MSYIIYNGEQVSVNFDVVDGQTLPTADKKGFCYFGKKYPGLRKRKSACRAVVVHHTAGDGNAANIYNTLRTRKSKKTGQLLNLGVHFTIDRDGTITQMGDIAFVLMHAGEANDWSVGIEIANRAVDRPGVTSKFPREATVEKVHGRNQKCVKFYPEQVEACKKLVNVLCELLELPKQVPMDAQGNLLRTALPPALLKVVRGVIGHWHITDSKWDPVPHILEEVRVDFQLRQKP